MLSFESDYVEGAAPEILQRLVETNLEQLSGYGEDMYCARAKEKIREACACPEAEVTFLVGGTQTNTIVITTMLQQYEGVISAKTGHINCHESGAIEACNHKVLTLPEHQGKIDPAELRNYLEVFYGDESHEHMVFPGMVYISHPTEYGTLYSKSELEELSGICRAYELPLFLDGARLGYGLMSRATDVTLPDIAKYCDVFYIGGTKVGALCGEAVVFTKHNMPKHFVTLVKQHGALLAKGRLLGIQFDTLFTDGLYEKLGKHAIDMAEKLKELFAEYGYTVFRESPTNQQFIVLDQEQMEWFRERVAFCFWEKVDENRTAVRFATSWATPDSHIDMLRELLEAYQNRS